MTTPTFAGFIAWVRSTMGVSTGDLPDNSDVLLMAYEISIATVNVVLAQVSGLIYTLAVYNLGGDTLINFAQDTAPSTFWASLRAQYAIFSFAPGVVTSSSDGGTSSSLTNPDFMKEFTLANLQNLKTPYGRQYLAWAQAYGTIWGLT